MSTWRVAHSLEKLRDQVNAAHPRRSKASDGTIGDAAHAATVSDHNPDRYGIVRALDITHDPVGTSAADRLDAHALADVLVASRDPRIKYVISRGRIARSYAKGTIKPYTWAPYTGADPHTSHAHVSVVDDSRADSTAAWQIAPKPAPPKGQFPGTVRLGGTGAAVRAWQTALNQRAHAGLVVDGVAGAKTIAAIRRVQTGHHLTVDGVAGPLTWAALTS